MNISNDILDDADALDINITPLIDIVFLLLIFFMVSTTFVENEAIKVNLPRASKNPAVHSEPATLSVAIDKAGQIYFKDKRISLDALGKAFSEGKGEKTTLVIRADSFANHGKVVDVMDTAKQNGITKIAIATEEK